MYKIKYLSHFHVKRNKYIRNERHIFLINWIKEIKKADKTSNRYVRNDHNKTTLYRFFT